MRLTPTLPAERLEEFKASLAEGKGWPEDIQKKFGASASAAGVTNAAEAAAKPAKPKRTRKKPAAA